MERHLSSLQDVVRLTIRQELAWSEQRFKRVTMSQDADGKPAELYGVDGKIYYRKAGGAGVELGTVGTVGAGGLYGTLGADFSLYGSASDDLTFVKFLEWDHDTNRLSTQTETITLGHDNTSASLSTGFYFYRGTTLNKEALMGWNETADRFEFIEEVSPTPILAEVLLRSLMIVSEPTNQVGTIEMNDTTGDMEFSDATTLGMKTLSELASGGGGLWLEDTSDAWLTTPKDILLQDENISGVAQITGSSTQHLGILSYTGRSMLLKTSGSSLSIWDSTLSAMFDSNEINLYRDVDINSNDILKCKNISGQLTGTDGADRLNLDFRGDANHRIYYTGAADNRLAYKTALTHAFAIGLNVITEIDTNGLTMGTGKYIKSISGDLELQVPSGSSIKFTAV